MDCAFTKDMLFIAKLSRRIFYSFLVVTLKYLEVLYFRRLMLLNLIWCLGN